MYQGYGDPNDDWATRGVETLMKRYPVFNKLYNWSYDDGTCLGALWQIGKLKHDKKMLEYVRWNFDRYVYDEEGHVKGYDPSKLSQDDICNGKMMIELYEYTKDIKFKRAADTMFKELRQIPRTKSGTFWHKKWYPNQVWLDGLYMGSVFYAKYQKAFGINDYYDDVVHQFLTAYQDTVDEKTGLCYHAYDESREMYWADPQTGHSPHFWSRAIGWFMMAMVDVLEYLPEDVDGRDQIIENYNALANALRKVADPATGLWYQVTDEGGRPINYLEQSGSSLILAALAKGQRLGYLKGDWDSFIDETWAHSLEQFITITAEGYVNTNHTCQVGGLGGANHRDGTYAYYMSEPVISNDHKGYGAFLYLAYEMERRK